MEKNSQKALEQGVDYAYGVLNAFKEAVAKVDPSDKVKVAQLTYEVAGKLPEIFGAMLMLVKEEHKGQVMEVMKAWASLLKYQQK